MIVGDEELVKRLRRTRPRLVFYKDDSREPINPDGFEAAARIEALQAEVEHFNAVAAELVRAEQRIAQLEAELAAARADALEEAAKVADHGEQIWGEPRCNAAGEIATAIRALKDHPHDV